MDISRILKEYIHSVLCANKLHDPVLNSPSIIQNYVNQGKRTEEARDMTVRKQKRNQIFSSSLASILPFIKIESVKFCLLLK